MLVTNVGENGMWKGNIFFEPKKNIEVSSELGEYLLKKYSNPKLTIHFQRALTSQEHEAVIESVEIEVPTADLTSSKTKRKYTKKAK